MKTLAVTGASGFVGRYVVRYAIERGWSVRALTRHPRKIAPAQNLVALHWEASREASPEILKNVDVICHLAASVPNDMSDPGEAKDCLKVNSLGTLQLLRDARTAGVPRFVHISSAYCQPVRGTELDADVPFFAPARAPYYCASKLVSEFYVDHWAASSLVSACILRLSSVYGAGMPQRDIIALFTQRLKAGLTVELYNGGLGHSDFVYVVDVAQAVVAAAERDCGGVFNIASGSAVSIRDMAYALAERLGARPDLIRMTESGRVSSGSFIPLNISRAAAQLDFHPSSLEDGLERFIEASVL